MELELNEYERKIFTVKAKEVDFGNVHAIAEWCKGTIEMQPTRILGTETNLPVIKIKGTGDARGKDFVATLGCFVVELKGHYRVYKPAQFHSTFSLKKVETDVEWQNHTCDGTCRSSNGEIERRVDASKETPATTDDEDEPFEPEKIELVS